MGGINLFGVIASLVTCLGCLFAILACSLNLWISNSTVKSGLWISCSDNGLTTKCDDITSDNAPESVYSGIQTARAMLILGILISAVAVTCGVLVLTMMRGKNLIYLAAAGLDIIAGIFFMIGFAVYAGEVKENSLISQLNFHYDASFALDILAWLLLWVSGGLFIVAKMFDRD